MAVRYAETSLAFVISVCQIRRSLHLNDGQPNALPILPSLEQVAACREVTAKKGNFGCGPDLMDEPRYSLAAVLAHFRQTASAKPSARRFANRRTPPGTANEICR